MYDVRTRTRTDGVHALASGNGTLKQELLRIYFPPTQIILRPLKRFQVAKRQPKSVLDSIRTAGARIAIGTQLAITTKDAAQVASLVIDILQGRVCESASPHQLVVQG
jgi:hypothetical protein